jgi:hypothetical protein
MPSLRSGRPHRIIKTVLCELTTLEMGRWVRSNGAAIWLLRNS